MLPPSSTTRRPLCVGCHVRCFSDLLTSVAATASRLWLLYFAHPLNRQCVQASAPLASFIEIGPESRIQPRSVGTRKKSTFDRLAPDFARISRTFFSSFAFSTRR